jgi:2-polyprenyl-3-methyl-5-hydroxy-6-metoxy-1,4-benzoquinol methylase
MTNCNSCESEKHKELFNIKKHKIVQCQTCNLKYIKNPMTPEESKEYYESEYYQGTDGTASTSCYSKVENFRIKEAEERLNRLGKTSSILDVGCGTGYFISAASRKNISAIGIDLSQNAVDYGKKKGLNLIQGDLLNISCLENKSFDTITFWASIEHLLKPRETLQKAYELLKTKGQIIIETGNVDSYLSKIYGKNWRLIQEDHNFYFSQKTLDMLLKNTGFKTIKTEKDGFVESIITQLGLRSFILKKFSESEENIKNKSSSLKELINQSASYFGLGDVMIKTAVKI